MAGDDDGGAQLLVHLTDEAGDGDLRRGVEIVERLVEYEHLGIDEHGADDANLLAVTLRELPQVFLRAENLAVHERLVLLQTVVERLLAEAVDPGDETEILLGRVEVDEEAAIDKRAGELLPGGVLCDAAAVGLYIAAGGLYQVEHQAHERGLARSVVADESHQLARADGQLWNVEHGIFTILLDKVTNLDIHGFVNFCSVRNRCSGAFHS